MSLGHSYVSRTHLWLAWPRLATAHPYGGPCVQPPTPQTERWSRGASFLCKCGAGLSVEWTLPSLASTHSLAQLGPDPQALGEACKGCWAVPLGGSGWGVGWALGVADLPGAARGTDLTGSHPPGPGCCRSRRLGPITESLGAGPSFSWRVGVGSPSATGPGGGESSVS